VHELNLPERCILTAILRRGKLILPRGNTVIEEADEVIAVVHSSAVAELAALLGPP
jgi:trk system potassium uptake protein TrkA